MNKEQFEQLHLQGYNRIPVYRSVLADLDTPLSVYLKLAEGKDSYLLESVEGGETWGRYSIIGLPCRRRYTVRGRQLTVVENGQAVSEETVADPLAHIAKLPKEFNVPRLAELPLFSGGLVGFFGFETVHLIEPKLAAEDETDVVGTADIARAGPLDLDDARTEISKPQAGRRAGQELAEVQNRDAVQGSRRVSHLLPPIRQSHRPTLAQRGSTSASDRQSECGSAWF